MRNAIMILSCLCVSILSAQTPGTLKWSFDTKDEISGSAVIGEDGTIYVGSKSNVLYAINEDGSLKWTFEAAGTISASPSIASDGSICFGSLNFKFYVINPDGTLKWEYTTGVLNDNSPAIGADGTIYNASSDGLYAFQPDGVLKWKYDLFNSYSTPAIAKDGTIYMGMSSDFYAFNPDGTKKWSVKIGEIESSPAIGADGTIYVGSKDENLYALNQDGTTKWKFFARGLVLASPVIGVDGTIYVGSYNNTFYAINPDGTEKWSFLSGLPFIKPSAAAIGSNGVIYLSATDATSFWMHKFVALNPDGSVKWVYDTDLVLYSAPSIGADGTIYVGTSEGELLAIHGESTGLANSSWPKLRGNSKNTGLEVVTTSFNTTRLVNKEGTFSSSNFPNPFSELTSIRFTLPTNAFVNIKVYNLLGEKIDVLLNSFMVKGKHTVDFNPENTNCSSGLLFYRIESNGLVETATMMLNK